MYGHAQHASGRARMSGAMTAALITAVTAYGVSVAATRSFIPPVQEMAELFILTPEKPQEVKPLPVEEKKVVIEKPKELLAPPIEPPPQVVPVMTAPPAPVEPAPAPAPITAPSGDRTPPKLQVASKPPYPAQSLRAQEEGTTHLEVCVTSQGRVQSVNVIGGSGHPRLDQAAAQWMRNARFTPGKVGGVPQAMCGHDVYYQWKLEDAT
jgi:periplasmic protein TonB